MRHLEDIPVYTRHLVQAAGMLIALGIGWATMNGRVGAVERQQDKESATIVEMRDDLGEIKTEQAVIRNDIQNVKKQIDKQDDKLDRILERLPKRNQ